MICISTYKYKLDIKYIEKNTKKLVVKFHLEHFQLHRKVTITTLGKIRGGHHKRLWSRSETALSLVVQNQIQTVEYKCEKFNGRTLRKIPSLRLGIHNHRKGTQRWGEAADTKN